MELFSVEEIWSRSLLAKIEGLIPWQVFDHLSRCGRDELYQTCMDCGRMETHYYRCNLKFCPQCNWRIARARTQLLQIWAHKVTQPKHVVLTRRNHTGILTRSLLTHTMNSFCKIRRTKLFKGMKGGCVSMEITNEGQGWHVHLHILCDARWIEGSELAVKWGKLMGQDFAIVNVDDAREKDYCKQVTKYVCKGSQMVTWAPEEIAQFIHAVTGKRFFATFGTMFDLRSQVRAQINFMKPPPKKCECGCGKFRHETEANSICGEIKRR